MATKAYVITLRNDIPQGMLQTLDLFPNTSQRNQIYDPPGQTGYVRQDAMMSNPAQMALTTYTDDNGAALQVSDGATTGLVAYLMERVHCDPGSASATAADNNSFLSAAQAMKAASLICADVLAGTSLSAARIQIHLTAAVATAPTELIGDTVAVGSTESYGTVEDVVKILAGHTYTVPDATIIGSEARAAGCWRKASERETLVDAETTALGYTAPIYSGGSFSAFTGRQLYLGQHLSSSIASGSLSQYTSSTYNVVNAKTTSGANSGVAYSYAMDADDYTYSASAVLATTIMPVSTVASGTAANPCVITTSEEHGLANGDKCYIINHDGVFVAAGPYTVANVAGKQFEVVEATTALTTGYVVYTDANGAAKYSVPASSSVSVGTQSLTGGSMAAIRIMDEDGTVIA